MVQPLAIRAAVCNYVQQTCLFACLPRQKCASAAPSHFIKGQSVHLVRWAHTARHPMRQDSCGHLGRKQIRRDCPPVNLTDSVQLLILLKRTSFRIDFYNWGSTENMRLLDEMMLTKLKHTSYERLFSNCSFWPRQISQTQHDLAHLKSNLKKLIFFKRSGVHLNF